MNTIMFNLKSNLQYKVDGGYGWLIVLASFILHFILVGIQFSYGIFLNEYMKQKFDNVEDKSRFALVGSISLSLLAGLGFVSGKLTDKFGYRPMVYLGSTLFSIALILASFSTKLWHLYLTQGILSGIGSSIAYIPCLSIISNWFDKKRGLATGIAVSGSGIGGLVLSPIIELFIINYGLAVSLRIIGIFSFVTCIVFTSFIKLRVDKSKDKGSTDDAKLNIAKLCLDIKFCLLWLDGLIQNLGFLVPIFLMPIYCEYYGLSRSTASIIVGLLNGTSAIGRILLGQLADKFGKLNIFTIATFLITFFSLFIWLFAFNLASIITFSVLFGLVSGVYSSLIPSIVPDIFGTENIASIMGLAYTSCGIANLCGPPIAAALMSLENSQNFTNPFTPMILFTAFSSFCGVLIFLILKWNLYHSIFIKC
ncbi:MFS general substrate transporter [Neoconidiobolus thromboides FSU 785]|nr:MFS general substrate transporter [Neoconidiobolus thromboides FSU 785]